MKYMTLQEYLDTCYTPKSRPSKQKIIRLIRDGTIRGKKHGHIFYIDVEHEAQARRTGHFLVDKVLEELHVST